MTCIFYSPKNKIYDIIVAGKGRMEILTSHQKVADLLFSLSPKDVANVIRPMDESELMFVGESILKHGRQKPKKTIEEDSHVIISSKAISKASSKASIKMTGEVDAQNDEKGESFLRITANDFSEIEVIKALYRLAFGRERAEHLVEKLLRVTLNHSLSFLNKYSPNYMYMAIYQESNRIISIIMGVLQPKTAAQLIRMFEPDRRLDIIKAIAVQQSPSDEAIKIIERTLKQRLHKLSEEDSKKEKPKGEENLFHILEQLNHIQQDNILNSLEDSSMKERLELNLFSWDELELMHQTEIEKILENFQDIDIARLLLHDGIDAEVVLNSVISSGRMKIIEDEINLMKKDIVRMGMELKEAKLVKKRFFGMVKEYARGEERV